MRQIWKLLPATLQLHNMEDGILYRKRGTVHGTPFQAYVMWLSSVKPGLHRFRILKFHSPSQAMSLLSLKEFSMMKNLYNKTYSNIQELYFHNAKLAIFQYPYNT